MMVANTSGVDIAGVDIAGAVLEHAPVAPWHQVSAALAAAAAVALASRLVLARRSGSSFSLPVASACTLLGVACAGLLAWSAWRPRLALPPEDGASHLAVVLDVSDSVLRADGGWPTVRGRVVGALEEAVSAAPRLTARASTASVALLADGSVSVHEDIEASELAVAVSRIQPSSFPPTGASDIEDGLRRAGRVLQEAAGRGGVLLVTDGHQTRGDALAAARDLARRGVPVHVLSVAAPTPEVGLAGLDLPPLVEAGTRASLRALLVNHGDRPADVRVAVTEESGRTVFDDERTLGAELDVGEVLRAELAFDRVGIRNVGVALTGAGGRTQARHRFAHVIAPARVLAVGGDTRWVQALPPDRYEVVVASPEDLGVELSVEDFDAVVTNGVVADRIAKSQQEEIVRLVEQRALGLLVMNGEHSGDEEAKTVLMTYEDTPLEPLLPVTSRPRESDERPPRHVVILIDTSGSMGGWKIEKSKAIAAHVIRRLRGVDRLDLVAFTAGKEVLVTDRLMTPDGKDYALAKVAGLQAGGGTDPSEALSLLEGRRFTECGLFFISDGHFEELAHRPDCVPTVFAVGSRPHDIPPILRRLSEPHAVGPKFDPRGIKIGFFDDARRKKRFEPGRYRPLTGIDALQRGWPVLPDPEIPLVGNAVTRPREDAEIAAVRPRYLDPVLAYRSHGAGTVGAFTTELPQAWLRADDGRRAIQQWIDLVLAYADRERFLVEVDDREGPWRVRVTLLAQAGGIPRIDRLEARVELEGGEILPLRLRPDAARPGTFVGRLRSPSRAQAKEGWLVLRGFGVEAAPRAQRVALSLPAVDRRTARASDEDWVHGLNDELLREIVAAGAGRLDAPPSGLLRAEVGHSPDPVDLWPWAVVAAVVTYLLQVLVRRSAA